MKRLGLTCSSFEFSSYSSTRTCNGHRLNSHSLDVHRPCPRLQAQLPSERSEVVWKREGHRVEARRRIRMLETKHVRPRRRQANFLRSEEELVRQANPVILDVVLDVHTCVWNVCVGTLRVIEDIVARADKRPQHTFATGDTLALTWHLVHNGRLLASLTRRWIKFRLLNFRCRVHCR